jgi:hypothetical protein
MAKSEKLNKCSKLSIHMANLDELATTINIYAKSRITYVHKLLMDAMYVFREAIDENDRLQIESMLTNLNDKLVDINFSLVPIKISLESIQSDNSKKSQEGQKF